MKNNLSSNSNVPGYIKYFVILSSLVLTGYVLVLARPLFIPLLAALIVALLLKPFSTAIEKLKLPRAISTILSVLLLLIFVAALSTFFSVQIAGITSDTDTLMSGFNTLFDKAQAWTTDNFGIAPNDQIVYLKSSFSTVLENSSAFFKNTLFATAGFLSTFVLFILALFFFLYYRAFLVSFLYLLTQKNHHHRVTMILSKIERVVRKYILGLLLVITIMATLNITGLLILGVKHAVFFGAFAAILTIIPYVGIIVGSLLPIVFTLTTMDSLWYPLGVLALFIGVQFFEGNFITPNIIGNQVSINPFAAILGLLIGGMMFGIAGVIFALPLLAISKVVCDEINALKPLGYLMGSPPVKKI
jgi:predicted PurR-regulated permease PerM